MQIYNKKTMESHLESQSIDIGKRSHCDGWLNDSLNKYIYIHFYLWMSQFQR